MYPKITFKNLKRPRSKWIRTVYLVACLLATVSAAPVIGAGTSVKHAPKGASKDTTRDTTQETAKDTAKGTVKDTAKETAKDTEKNTAKDTAKETAKDTEKNTAKDAGKDTAKDIGKDPAKNTAGETAAEDDSNVAKVKTSEHNELLYKLLMAELARNRQMKEESLKNALEAAQKSQDPAIAAYATELAIQFQTPEPAVISSEIWAKNAKNDLQAQMVAATLLIGQSVERAIPYLTQAIALEPIQVNQHLSAIQSRLSERSAEHLKVALQTIAKTKPQDAYVQLIAAQSTAQQGDIPKGNYFVDEALKINPQLTPAIQLKARLIRYEDTSDTRALKYLSDKVTKYPNNGELRLFLASALMDARRLNEAAAHLNKLTADNALGGKAKLFLGEIYIVDNKPEKARGFLENALTHSEVADNARYDLGELAESQKNPTEAVQWYSSVNPGPYHVPATLRSVFILKRNKAYTEAMRILRDATPTTFEDQKQLLLSEVDILAASNQLEDARSLSEDLLTKLPDDADVLLSHSMVASKMKQWKVAENDLNTILSINPNHAEALNAMGYLLSLQKDRLEEAKGYLIQALKINPKNPSYLDSMGWILYKMGDYKAAIFYLEKAQSLSKDPEIAVHLAEVLWVSGQQNQALNYLIHAYKQDPDNVMLAETVQRLKVESPMLKFKEPKAIENIQNIKEE